VALREYERRGHGQQQRQYDHTPLGYRRDIVRRAGLHGERNRIAGQFAGFRRPYDFRVAGTTEAERQDRATAWSKWAGHIEAVRCRCVRHNDIHFAESQ